MSALTVRVIVGARAYACIDDGSASLDLLLPTGKGAPAGLREVASNLRAEAERLAKRAELAEAAANMLESDARPADWRKAAR